VEGRGSYLGWNRILRNVWGFKTSTNCRTPLHQTSLSVSYCSDLSFEKLSSQSSLFRSPGILNLPGVITAWLIFHDSIVNHRFVNMLSAFVIYAGLTLHLFLLVAPFRAHHQTQGLSKNTTVGLGLHTGPCPFLVIEAHLVLVDANSRIFGSIPIPLGTDVDSRLLCRACHGWR
jgi:hypothetical protein